MTKGQQIRILLLQGTPYNEIVRQCPVSKATISYHARKLGLSKGIKPKYDWDQISREINAGATLKEIRQKYGCAKATIDKARKRGAIEYLTIARMTALQYAQSIQGKARPWHRSRLRSKLIKEGRPNECAMCKIREWNGKKISLELDHIDGRSENNHPDNLRLLCPNCHSQTETWRGRNQRWRKGRVAA